MYKKDPGRRSLSLAAERESQSSLPFFAYERTAWMNAKRLEQFRAKQKRLLERKRIWEELKKEVLFRMLLLKNKSINTNLINLGIFRTFFIFFQLLEFLVM